MTAMPYRHRLCRCAVITATALAATACSDSGAGHQTVPLPYAYPRISVLDSSYRDIISAGLVIGVNTGATVSRQSDTWTDIRYPSYRGTLHLSVNRFSTPEELARAIANRTQRISLDIGDNYAGSTTFGSGSFECHIVETDGTALTPIHILAADTTTLTMLSGTFALDNAATGNADSIAPVIKAVRADAMHLLTTLRHNGTGR